MRIGARQAREGFDIAVRRVLRQLNTGAGLPGEQFEITNGHASRIACNDATPFHALKVVAGRLPVDSRLSGEKLRREWKYGEARPMRVGQQPSGDTLFAGVKLAATNGDHNVTRHQKIIAGQNSLEIRQTREVLHHARCRNPDGPPSDLHDVETGGGLAPLHHPGAAASFCADQGHIQGMRGIFHIHHADRGVDRKMQVVDWFARSIDGVAQMQGSQLSERFDGMPFAGGKSAQNTISAERFRRNVHSF